MTSEDIILIIKYLIIANIIKLLRAKLPLICCSKGFFLKDSFDRKPNPGMFLKAAKDHNINLWMSKEPEYMLK